MATYSYSGNKKHKKKQNHASEYLPYLINELADEIEVVEQVLSGGEEGQVLAADSAGKAQWTDSLNDIQDEIEIVEQVLSGGEEGQVLTADSAGKAQWAEASGGGEPLLKTSLSNIIVSGAGIPEINGEYAFEDYEEGFPYYFNGNGIYQIFKLGNNWVIFNFMDELSVYVSADDPCPLSPELVETWVLADENNSVAAPPPTVTLSTNETNLPSGMRILLYADGLGGFVFSGVSEGIE